MTSGTFTFLTTSLIQLETDPAILVSKSRQALVRYGHQIVIGNLLQSRKTEVVLITKYGEATFKLSGEEIRNIIEIESKFVPELVKRHDEWIQQNHEQQ